MCVASNIMCVCGIKHRFTRMGTSIGNHRNCSLLFLPSHPPPPAAHRSVQPQNPSSFEFPTQEMGGGG